SYDDAVTPQQVYQALAQGGLVGGEGASETIRFDDLAPSASSSTSASYATINGSIQNFTAVTSIGWESWLFHGDQTLFHEYGEAWGEFYSFDGQQDPGFAAYLKARGLYGNSNVGSSLAWQPAEMIAEDYRELFGDSTAQAAPQMNTSIPPASQVSGLASFLAGAYRTPLAPTHLAATPGTGSVSLTWTEPSTDPGSTFSVSVNGTQVGTTTSNSYTVSGLSSGATYNFAVTDAWQGLNSSSASLSASPSASTGGGGTGGGTSTGGTTKGGGHKK
ncbi:MAG TPA: fibronectin type III domain-containing protein, partial [Acidimicrobiales bacterium]|nr:fibronectin type III domain-containing protein [Acidimicrobiales bacterium]